MKNKALLFTAVILMISLAACGPKPGVDSSGPAESSGVTSLDSMVSSETVSEELTSSESGSEAGSASEPSKPQSSAPSVSKLSSSSRAPSVTSSGSTTPAKVEYPLNKYDLHAYTQPYWSGDIVYNESVMVLADKDGNVQDIPLLYHADEIISVRKFHLATEYKQGRDYELVDGKLHIPSGSAITPVAYSTYYPAAASANTYPLNSTYGSGFLYFSEGSKLHTMQIAVTYRHSDKYTGTVPVYKGNSLPKTTAKLKGGQKLNILVYGDSISTGANSSGAVNVAPNAPAWYDMFFGVLKEKYKTAKLSMVNTSVGGMTSEWGAANAEERAADKRPDLCIIGFGMNDGTAKMPAADFKKNIQTIMDAVTKKNPDCEFILISTSLPNKEAYIFYGNQKEYLPVLKSLEKTGTVVADMTTFHEDLLARKRFCDMTGNNINHPNDFLARAYAQLMCRTVIEGF